MAKIRQYDLDIYASWIAFGVHLGDIAGGSGNPWHLIWQLQFLDLPGGLASFGMIAPDEPTAILFAQNMAALPQLNSSFCPFCWDYDLFHLHTPRYPRWNIYRGWNHTLTVPAIYWDIYNPDPPPGFKWDGS